MVWYGMVWGAYGFCDNPRSAGIITASYYTRGLHTSTDDKLRSNKLGRPRDRDGGGRDASSSECEMGRCDRRSMDHRRAWSHCSGTVLPG